MKSFKHILEEKRKTSKLESIVLNLVQIPIQAGISFSDNYKLILIPDDFRQGYLAIKEFSVYNPENQLELYIDFETAKMKYDIYQIYSSKEPDFTQILAYLNIAAEGITKYLSKDIALFRLGELIGDTIIKINDISGKYILTENCEENFSKYDSLFSKGSKVYPVRLHE
jgi:hypothetical protein